MNKYFYLLIVILSASIILDSCGNRRANPSAHRGNDSDLSPESVFATAVFHDENANSFILGDEAAAGYLVSFFSMNCKSCIEEMKLVSERYQAFVNANIKVIAVSTDPQRMGIYEMIKKYNFKFKIVRDYGGDVLKSQINPTGTVPTTLIVSRAGAIYRLHYSENFLKDVKEGFAKINIKIDLDNMDANPAPNPTPIKTPKPIETGSDGSYPEISLKNTQGEDVSLKTLARHRTVFEFFSIGCISCGEAAVVINELVHPYCESTHKCGVYGVEVMGAWADVPAFKADYGLTYPGFAESSEDAYFDETGWFHNVLSQCNITDPVAPVIAVFDEDGRPLLCQDAEHIDVNALYEFLKQ